MARPRELGLCLVLVALAVAPALCQDDGGNANAGATVVEDPQMAAGGAPAEVPSAVEDTRNPPPPPPPPPSPLPVDKKSAKGGDKAGGLDVGNLDPMMLAGVAVAVVVGGAGAWFLLCAGEGKQRFKGDAIFLIGPCGGGKTAIFFKLHDGKGALRGTQTSMIKNEATMSLEGAGAPVRLVDCPGHLRLRHGLFSTLEDCCAVVFVLDSSSFIQQAKSIAEMMLDLMCSPALLKHADRMLVVCNQTDKMPDDLAGIQPKNLVRKRLETEIEALRASRESGLQEQGGNEQVQLEVQGGAFKWSDSPLEATFIDYSAKLDDASPLVKWIAQVRG